MKKKWLGIAGVLAATGLLAGLFVYFFVYNKPHIDYSKVSPDIESTATKVFEEFRSNPSASSSKYNGKVLLISGELSAVEQTDSLTIAVFSFEEGLFGSEGIRCTMIPEHANEITNTPPGSAIMLKGYCTGYNDTDVIMEYCSIVK